MDEREELRLREAELSILVNKFAADMRAKLRLRWKSKGGWKEESVATLTKLLIDEVQELIEATILFNQDMAKPEDVVGECVDVANFAAFIADIYRRALPGDRLE